MAAPSASAILADLGADVIKVEPLTGDPMRGRGRPAKVDGAFEGLRLPVRRRQPRQAVDRGRARHRRRCRSRAAVWSGRADIFMCNLLTHRQARFGLDPANLLAINPKLVHATLTGYGTTGPEAKRPGYDVTAFFGRSGLYDASREGDDGDGADGASGARRPHDRARAGRRDPRRAADGRTHGPRSGRRDLAVRDRGLDAGDRLRRHGGRPRAGPASRAASAADAHRQPLSVRRRQMGGVQHAGRIGVAASCAARSAASSGSPTNASRTRVAAIRTWPNWSTASMRRSPRRAATNGARFSTRAA